MTETIVVNKYKDNYDVYIGRGSQFGNPYSTRKSKYDVYMVETKEEAIQKYKEMWLLRLNKYPEHTKKMLMALKGKKLGCTCKPKVCHGDVLVELIAMLEVESE